MMHALETGIESGLRMLEASLERVRGKKASLRLRIDGCPGPASHHQSHAAAENSNIGRMA